MKIIENTIEQFKFKKLKELKKQEEAYKYGKDIVDSFLNLTEDEKDIIKESAKSMCIFLDRDYSSTAEMICRAISKSNEESIEIMQSVGITLYVDDFREIIKQELTVKKTIRKMIINKLKESL